MGVVKRSVSFDADVWDALTSEAGGGAVSPLINDALVHYLRRRRGLVAMEAYEAEFGAFTEAELAEADRVLDFAGVADLTVTTAGSSKGRRSSTPRASRSRARA
ncbi:MAG TPA: hypothetical protein VG899_07580 [Mycobacteriales bacterium]|nr:hypothetical protein [Mycobacteriales bacterium]